MFFAAVFALQAACLDDLKGLLFAEHAPAAQQNLDNCLWPQLDHPAADALRLNATTLRDGVAPRQRDACRSVWIEYADQTLMARAPTCPNTKERSDDAMIARCRADQGSMETINRISEAGSPPGCDSARRIAFFQSVFIRFEGAAFLKSELGRGRATPERSPAYWDAAYPVAQHAEMAPEIQAAWLEALTAAVESGAADPYQQAALTDRLSMARGEGQLYGTHTSCVDGEARFSPPLADERAAAARRRSLGMGAISDFLAKRAEEYCR